MADALNDDFQPKMTDGKRMLELVERLSPATRTRIAQRLDDRFHELTDNEEPSLDPSEVKRRERQAEAVERWNNHHPVGTMVRYWTCFREGAGIESVTRTPAQMLHGHTAVVWVEGHSACIALSHVEAITEQDGGAA